MDMPLRIGLRITASFSFMLGALLTDVRGSEAQPAPAVRSQGISLDDVVALLGAGSSSDEIIPELTKRGFSGAADVETLRKIKQAGGDVALLLAVKKAAGAAPAPLSAPSAASPPMPAQAPAAAPAADAVVVPPEADGKLPKTCDQWDELGDFTLGYAKFRKGAAKEKSWGLVGQDGKIALKAGQKENEMLLWRIHSGENSSASQLRVVYWDHPSARWLIRSMRREYDFKSERWGGNAFESVSPAPLDETINWLGEIKSSADLAWYREKTSNKYGFVSAEGAIVIPARYDEVTDFAPQLPLKDSNAPVEPEFPDFWPDDEPEKSSSPKAPPSKPPPPPQRSEAEKKEDAFMADLQRHGMSFRESSGKAAKAFIAPVPVALVRTGNKWGAVNADGREAIPLDYDKASVVIWKGRWTRDAACVQVSANGRQGLFDTHGTQLLPPAYERVQLVEESDLAILEKEAPPGTEAVRKPRERSREERQALEGHNLLYSLYRMDNRTLLQADFADYRLLDGSSAFLWGTDGRNYLYADGKLTPVPWADMRPSANNPEFSYRLLAVARQTPEGLRWGFVWPDGTMAIEPRWKHVSDFYSCGLAYVSNDDHEMVILGKDPPTSGPNALADASAAPAADKNAVGRDTGHYGLIDCRGKLLHDMNLTVIGILELPLGGGLSMLGTYVKMDGRWGWLDTEGAFNPKGHAVIPIAEWLKLFAPSETGQ